MKHTSVLFAICCLVSAVSAQFLETTIQLDSNNAPSALCYNSQNNKIYCANHWVPDYNVTVIDGATDSVIAIIPSGQEPLALCYNSQNNKVYCVNYYIASVMVIDGASDSVVATVGTVAPWALCYNPQSNKVYCANRDIGEVTVIDGGTD